MSSTTIEVAKYIHDLLYEYSSVIVPDLGAFSTRNQMATINEDTHTISPPVKTVVFNERLKVNDGILVGHIAKMESIPPSLVEEALKQFAATTKATLQAGEAVALGSLGTLQESEKGIEFYPTANLNFSLNSFGFETLELPTVAATTPPSSNENIGAAGIGGTSELDFSLDEEKDLPEEEIEGIPSEKRTVSSVLAENAQNLPPVIPPEQRRRSGGGWFWLLPLVILGLCILLIIQLSKNDNKDRMTGNDTNTEESSGLWSVPPFSWFAGGGDKNDELADNNSVNNNSNSDNTADNQDGNDNSNNDATGDGDIVTVDTDEGNSDNTNSNNNNNTDNGNSTSGNTGTNTDSGNSTSGDTDTNTDNGNSTIGDTGTNTDSDNSTSGNTDTNTDNTNTTANGTSTNDNEDSETNSSNSANATLTNTAALNSINIAEAKEGEYVTSNAPKGYYIIIGAFKSKSNANKVINNLKGNGYEAYALQTSSGYYRVGIYGSTDGNIAKERYIKARENENSKAWMLSY